MLLITIIFLYIFNFIFWNTNFRNYYSLFDVNFLYFAIYINMFFFTRVRWTIKSIIYIFSISLNSTSRYIQRNCNISKFFFQIFENSIRFFFFVYFFNSLKIRIISIKQRIILFLIKNENESKLNIFYITTFISISFDKIMIILEIRSKWFKQN